MNKAETASKGSDLNLFKDDFFKRFDSSEVSESNTSDLKQDMMSAVRDLEHRMKLQYERFTESVTSRLTQHDTNFRDVTIKIEDLNSSSNTNKIKIDKIADLCLFQKKASDQLISHDVKLNAVHQDVRDAIQKYDKIFFDNLVVPGTVGDYCRFKNVREYLEYNISQISSLVTFKEKQTLDLKNYKENLDSMIRQMAMQMENTEKNLKYYTSKLVEQTEDTYKKEISELGNKLSDLRIENHKQAYNLQKTASDLSVEHDKILAIKSEIYKQLEQAVQDMSMSHSFTVKDLENTRGEFDQIKKKFVEIAEFIKDVRFRRNLGVDVTRKDLKQMAGRLASDRRISMQVNDVKTDQKEIKEQKELKSSDKNIPLDNSVLEDNTEIESYVKKYIHGTANQSKKSNKVSNEDVVNNGAEEKTEIKLEKANDGCSLKVPLNNQINKGTPQIKQKTEEKMIIEVTDENQVIPNEEEVILVKTKTKFKDKFPLQKELTPPKVDREEVRRKTVKIQSETSHKLNADLDSIQNVSEKNLTPTPGMNNKFVEVTESYLKKFDTLSGNYSDFKKDFVKKLACTEKKVNEMEYFSKKKLEELTAQIKIFIPINFNPYYKNYDSAKQINGSDNLNCTQNGKENFDVNKIQEKNVVVNYVDPSLTLKNKEMNVLSKTPVMTNTRSKSQKPKEKLSPALKGADLKIGDIRSMSKDKKLIINGIVSETEQENEMSFIENMKILKKIQQVPEKSKRNTVVNNTIDNTKFSKTNYFVHLSTHRDALLEPDCEN